jgi:hypothetical protein
VQIEVLIRDWNRLFVPGIENVNSPKVFVPPLEILDPPVQNMNKSPHNLQIKCDFEDYRSTVLHY